MKRIGVIGDLHLGKLQSFITDHLELQIAFVKKILTRLKDEGITKVVLLGDVFDKPNPSMEIQIGFLNLVLSFPNIEFLWVCGNHDKNSIQKVAIDLFQYFSKEAIPNLSIFTKPTKIGSLGFLPYPHKIPISFLNFAHVDRPGVKWDNGFSPKLKSDWDEKANFVIGHIHLPQVVGKCYYTGSPFQLSFGESLPKYFAIVEYSKSQQIFNHIAIQIEPPYILKNQKIKSEKKLEKICKVAKQNKRQNKKIYYKLDIAKKIKLPVNFLQDYPEFVIATVSRTISLKENMNQIQNEPTQINPLFLLDSFLKQSDIPNNKIAWAIKKVKEIIQ